MHFQGETCTLSFGIHFMPDHILLTGSIWFRRDNPVQSKQTAYNRTIPDRIPFQLKLTNAKFSEMRHWLAVDTKTPFQLPAPLRHLSRISPQMPDVNVIDLELTHDQLPSWWNWDVVFPLTVRLTIRPTEYAYLTGILSREYWSADLTW